MHPLFAKTFGGLSAAYYIRQFIFGLLFPIFIYLMLRGGDHSLQLPAVLILAVNTLLYPYSRFVYESVVSFIVGENTFGGDAVFFIAMKLATMLACWTMAIFVAPIGLAYLYFHHNKVSD